MKWVHLQLSGSKFRGWTVMTVSLRPNKNCRRIKYNFFSYFELERVQKARQRKNDLPPNILKAQKKLNFLPN